MNLADFQEEQANFEGSIAIELPPQNCQDNIMSHLQDNIEDVLDGQLMPLEYQINHIAKQELINKIQEILARRHPPNTEKAISIQQLTDRRVQFLQDLIKSKGALTEQQILSEMGKVDALHQYSKGKKVAISRKALQHVMKMSHVLPRLIPSLQRTPSSAQTIKSRYNYARRYLQLTEQSNVEICFLGEYSFCNNVSLSSCPIMKRDNFVNLMTSRCKKTKIMPKQEDVADRWGRNLQILVGLSLHGVVYYQLYSNIFAECNFLKTVMAIARQMCLRNPHQQKYLIVETSFFHQKCALRRVEQCSPVRVVFLPPETPMLNPTEYFFSELKQLVRSISYKQHRAYGAVATELLESMREKKMQSHFFSIRPYMELALRQQSFK